MKPIIFSFLIAVLITSMCRSQTDCDLTINYATSETYPEHIPIYYIYVNVHFMLLEDPDNPGNFTEINDGKYPTPETSYTGYNYANDLIELANSHLENNEAMFLPLGNTTPVLQIRYRYKLAGDGDPSILGDDGIYFHRDDCKYYFILGSSHSFLVPEPPMAMELI
ncbi:MAG: hypothetical protein ACKVPJ_10500 [Chitinophagales bacterium]